MNPAQRGLLSSILRSQVKPYVLSYSNVFAAAATLTVTIPRAPGKLCIVVTAAKGGSATPGLLTGFTSLAGTAVAANVLGVRIQYKYLNGSEAVTLASAAASATEMCAHVFLIEGAISTRVPTISTVANSFTPTAVTVTAPQTQTLVIALMFSDTMFSYSNPPPGVGPYSVNAGNASCANYAAWRSGFALSSIIPGAWVGTAGVGPRTYTIAVRGI